VSNRSSTLVLCVKIVILFKEAMHLSRRVRMGGWIEWRGKKN